VRGKKVRCKNCQGVIPVPAGPDQRITTAKAKTATETEAEVGRNPYIITETSLAPRCPHCAYELDPPDSLICLHCGYHMVKRRRVPSVKTYENTAADYLLWWLPGIGMFILGVALIGYCFLHHFILPGQMLNERDVKELERYRINPFSDYAKWDDATALLFYWPLQMWLFLILGYLGYRCLKFAFKRLILHFHPPERVVER
jgi:hypothetical protein